MKKLTTQEISFINRYLKNSGVKYADIRYEMTDHVATALEELEGDFYDNFKQYMLEHKEELLKSNKEFSRAARIKAVELVFENFIGRRSIFLIMLLFNMGILLSLYIDERMVRDGYQMSSTVLFISGALFYFRRKNSEEKVLWSGTDKLLGTSMTVIYLLEVLLKVGRFIDTTPVLILYYSLLNCLIISIFVSYRQLNKKYKLQYNG